MLGGYAEADVAPWRSEDSIAQAPSEAPLAARSIKELKKYLAERGVAVPTGLEKSDLVTLARRRRPTTGLSLEFYVFGF